MAHRIDDKSAEMLNDDCKAIEVENMKPGADPEANHGDTQQSIIVDPKREKALV